MSHLLPSNHIISVDRCRLDNALPGSTIFMSSFMSSHRGDPPLSRSSFAFPGSQHLDPVWNLARRRRRCQVVAVFLVSRASCRFMLLPEGVSRTARGTEPRGLTVVH